MGIYHFNLTVMPLINASAIIQFAMSLGVLIEGGHHFIAMITRVTEISEIKQPFIQISVGPSNNYVTARRGVGQ